MFANDGAAPVRGALDEFIGTISSGKAQSPLQTMPHVLEAELIDVHEFLRRYELPGPSA